MFHVEHSNWLFELIPESSQMRLDHLTMNQKETDACCAVQKQGWGMRVQRRSELISDVIELYMLFRFDSWSKERNQYSRWSIQGESSHNIKTLGRDITTFLSGMREQSCVVLKKLCSYVPRGTLNEYEPEVDSIWYQVEIQNNHNRKMMQRCMTYMAVCTLFLLNEAMKHRSK